MALAAFTVRVLARRTEAPAAVIGAGLVCEPFFYIHMCEILRKEIVPSPSSIGVEYPHLPTNLILQIQLRALCFVLAFVGNCIWLNFIGPLQASRPFSPLFYVYI